MKKLIIFGKDYTIINKNSEKDFVRFISNKILVSACKRSADSLMREFLTKLLYSQLLKVYDKLKKRGYVEVFGGLDFKVVEKIDGRKQRIAKLRGNKILVKLNAIVLPRPVLEYVIAHEIAHIFTKRHTKKFWKIVELMCPHFDRSLELLTEYADSIAKPIKIQA